MHQIIITHAMVPVEFHQPVVENKVLSMINVPLSEENQHP